MKRTHAYFLAIGLAIGLGTAATFVAGKGRYFDIVKNLEIFSNLYRELNSNYVDEIDPNKLMKVGIDAMLATLDPFTNYWSESQIEGFRFRNEEGEASSGMQVKKIGPDLVIIRIVEDSPAHTAGLRIGDVIKSVNGQPTETRAAEDVMDIIAGQPGSEMSLDIMRPGAPDPLEIKLSRGGIDGKNVPYSGFVADGIGYISLTTFTRDAGRNVANALRAAILGDSEVQANVVTTFAPPDAPTSATLAIRSPKAFTTSLRRAFPMRRPKINRTP